MKKEKILATVMSCAIIAVSAGCGANKTASTTAAETTTTTAAETTTTSAETTTTTESETTDEENPMEMTAPLFGRGVWEVYDGDKLDSYYVFYDETSGVIIGAEYIEYVPFTCEQNGTEIMFHLGGADNNTPAVFDLGDATGTFTFGESEKAYRFAALDTDVDEFLKTNTAAIAAAQAAEEANPMEMTAPLFGRGVWEVYDGDMLDSYYVFYDETSGMTVSTDYVKMVPFTCEQNGTEIMFHLGGPDDNTPAVFDLGDATGTFTFGDTEKVYRFAALDTDVDEFIETHGSVRAN